MRLRNFIEDNELIPTKFKPILNTIKTLPCSTADAKEDLV